VIGAIIVVVILVVAAVAALFMFGLMGGPGGSNGTNGTGTNNNNGKAKTQMLVYDPTGENFNSGSRQLGGSGPGAYLVTMQGEKILSSTKVNVSDSVLQAGGCDPSEPAVISGDFKTSADGLSVDNILKGTDNVINDGSFMGYNFKNVEASLSSISVVVKQHTFGFGYGKQGKPIAYISIDKKPTFFTNVTIKGVVLPKNTTEALNFLDAAVSTEFPEFKDAFKKFSSALDIPNFELGFTVILAYSIEYDQPIKQKGDIIDIITPKDVDAFLHALNTGIDQKSLTFITDILDSIDMELIIMLDPKSTLDDLTMWFIVGVTDLHKEKAKGLVTLDMAEIKQQDIERELGITIPDFQKDPSFHVRFGVTGQRDLTPDLTHREVRGLWDIIGSTYEPAAGSTSTDCFAMVITLNDTLTYMESLFQTDLSTLKALTTVRNPGAGLIIDYNFTEVLDPDALPFQKYLGLILIPDYQLPGNEQVIHLAHVEGVVYDLGDFLKNPTYQFPVIIADSVTEGPAPTSYELKDIYDGATGNKTMVHLTTEGFATGTTMKTVAKYMPSNPIVMLIQKSPVDLNAYEVFEPAGGVRYHTALLSFNLTKETGPTYFMQKVRIQGFFINLKEFNKRIQSAMGLGSDLGAGDLIWQIIDAIGDFTGDKVLTGALVGYSVVPIPVEPSVPVIELHCYSSYVVNNQVEIFINGKVQNQGTVEFNPTVRIVVTNEAKTKMLFYNGSLADGNNWASFITLTGSVAKFSWYDQFSVWDLPSGNYSVDVYIMQWSLYGGIEKKLGEAHGTFTVFGSQNDVGYQFLDDSILASLSGWQITMNISLDPSVTTIKAAPTVVYWSVFLYIFPVLPSHNNMTQVSGTNEWALADNWGVITTGSYKYYFIVDMVVKGKRVELMTETHALKWI
jgi:hypothetical protein